MIKKVFKINDIPTMLEKEEITTKEAIHFLAEQVAKNPIRFGISPDDKELLSDISLRILQNTYFLFDHYKKEAGCFLTYFSSFLKFQILSAKRETAKSIAKEETLFNIQEQNMEYTQIDRSYNESNASEKTFHPYFPSVSEKAPFSRKKNDIHTFSKITESIKDENTRQEEMQEKILSTTHFTSLMEDKKPCQKQKKIVLALALKNSYYLKESHIQNISKFCEIDENELMDVVTSISGKLRPKIQKLEFQIQRRDYLYYMHKRYMHRLHDVWVSESTMEQYKKLYEDHTKKWNEKNSSFINSSKKICASNKLIAKLLGICERQVSHYIRNAKLIEDIDFQQD